MLASRTGRMLVRARMRARWMLRGALDGLNPPARLGCRICGFEAPAADFRELRARCIFEGGTLVRHQCPACGVIFGTERMLSLTPEQLAREYADVYRVHDEGATTSLELEAFRHLRPERGRKYLNYGAGKWSDAIAQLRDRGFDIVGFDKYAVSSENVINDPARLSEMRFDGIMSHSLMEHMVDPVGEMRSLRRLLRGRDSLMVHATPCFRYEIEYTRFHLFFFTGRSLEVIAEKAGLRVEGTDNPDVMRFLPVT